MTNNQFQDNKPAHKYELMIEGERSFIDYQQEGDIVYLLHTEVPEDQTGEGIASSLVQKTFEYMEQQNFKAVPSCSYVKAFLKRHPEWDHIITED
jgi:predicted GNAT family acetyltransferase